MSRPTAMRLVGLAIVGLLAAGCSGISGADPLEETPVATSQISVVDNEFEPIAAEVEAGTEVTWTWEGDNDHNVVADGFSSDVQNSGTFTQTFDEAGTYEYRCTLHGGMRGVIVVTDGGDAGASEEAS